MKRPSLFWRLLVRLERYLPPVSPATAMPLGDQGRGSVRGESARRRWTVLAAVLPSLIIAIVQVLTRHVDMATAWPVWRPIVLDLLLVAAGAALVAAVVGGAVAWRTEARRHA